MARRPRDLILDSITGDLVVADGDLVFAVDTENDPAGTAQLVRMALALFLGEWFLDEGKGVPWMQRIMVKNPNMVEVRQHIRAAILGVPGIIALLELTLAYDPAARKLSGAFLAQSDVGTLEGTI